MNRNLPHFSPLDTDSFAHTSLLIQESDFGKINVHDFFFVHQLDFYQFQAILGNNKC